MLTTQELLNRIDALINSTAHDPDTYDNLVAVLDTKLDYDENVTIIDDEFSDIYFEFSEDDINDTNSVNNNSTKSYSTPTSRLKQYYKAQLQLQNYIYMLKMSITQSNFIFINLPKTQAHTWSQYASANYDEIQTELLTIGIILKIILSPITKTEIRKYFDKYIINSAIYADILTPEIINEFNERIEFYISDLKN